MPGPITENSDRDNGFQGAVPWLRPLIFLLVLAVLFIIGRALHSGASPARPFSRFIASSGMWGPLVDLVIWAIAPSLSSRRWPWSWPVVSCSAPWGEWFTPSWEPRPVHRSPSWCPATSPGTGWRPIQRLQLAHLDDWWAGTAGKSWPSRGSSSCCLFLAQLRLRPHPGWFVAVRAGHPVGLAPFHHCHGIGVENLLGLLRGDISIGCSWESSCLSWSACCRVFTGESRRTRESGGTPMQGAGGDDKRLVNGRIGCFSRHSP